jgi:single-strand DNA-binding protein
MLSLNQITLAGNLGADLEVKTLDGGREVGRFRLAVNTQWKDANGKRQSRTDWFTCVLWNPKDGARKYLTKGTNLWLAGEVKVRTTDEATYFDVVVRQWRLVSFKDDEASGDEAEEEPAAGAVDPEFAAIFDEEPAPEAKARGSKAK